MTFECFRSSRGRVSDWRRGARANKELEKAAREGSLDIDLGQVRDSWVKAGAVYEDIMAAADLYGVFEDLFGHAYFRPCLMLDIRYAFKDVLVPVHRGNMVKPREAATAPKVTWKSDNNGLWCLMMTGLDSHLQSETSQYLHWMVPPLAARNGVVAGVSREICFTWVCIDLRDYFGPALEG